MPVTASARRHYDEPPLEEAIFELFAWPSVPWTPLLAAELGARLPAYSGKSEDLEDLTVYFQLGPGKSLAQGVSPGAQRKRLWTPDATRAAQFGAEMCTHNVRRPYGHFEDHLGPMREVFAAYLAVTMPQRLAWVGQRYLNIVRLPRESFPSAYFQMYPHLPDALPQGHRPFAVQVETVKFEHGSAIVNVALLELTLDAAVYTIDVYARSDDSVG